ncbi:9854_t:CDS:1, partial [Funneliformis geosporum]
MTDLEFLMKPSFQNKYNSAFTVLENKIDNARINKLTDSVLEESTS